MRILIPSYLFKFLDECEAKPICSMADESSQNYVTNDEKNLVTLLLKSMKEQQQTNVDI